MGGQEVYPHYENEMSGNLLALVLAAGEGTRFKSEKAKVLHPILGKSMVQLVLEAVRKLRPEKIYVVVGYQKEEVEKVLAPYKVNFIPQQTQLGTAHAAMQAEKELKKDCDKDVLILYGDMPLLTPASLRPLLDCHHRQGNAMTLMSAELENPKGFGRLIWSDDRLEAIVEEREATPIQRRLKEINAGIYLFRVKELLQALPQISNHNRKGEYYLTDIVEIFSRQKKKVGVYRTPASEEVVGVNSRFELARAAEVLRMRKIRKLTERGVTVLDPGTTWIDLDVRIGTETVIHSSVIIEGKSRVGSGCLLSPFVHLINTKVGNGVRILSSSVIEESVVEDGAKVGPFTHLRPGTVIRQGAKVGNFVELKNTDFGKHSKAGHLTYLGDSIVEEDANIGAGTITCNYDGFKKHKTHIEREAFIGSGVELVAPVKIGKGAYVGAGSTITKDVSPGALAVERSEQREKPGWVEKKRKKRKNR